MRPSDLLGINENATWRLEFDYCVLGGEFEEKVRKMKEWKEKRLKSPLA